MTSGVSTGSISLSGLLGGTAGSIDTTSLIASLMQAQALPQTALKNQLAVQQAQTTAYQAINTKIAALLTAGQALTDPGAWTATAASSSSGSVVATSTGTASVGTSTFSVTALAQPQITTVLADGGGNVVNDPSAGITIGGHSISLTSGSAADVAAAINTANVGVRANVIQSDSGQLLQLTSTTTGSAASFAASGFQSTPNTVSTAQDAQVTVGDPNAGGYTVSSSSNTFTGVIPGVTFSVSGLASNVSVTVTQDQQSISDKVKALVAAANAATAEISNDSTQGAILQGSSDVQMLSQSILSAVSHGTSTGGSLSTYGIDMDKNGVMSFDADTFAAAYNADPAGTKAAISGSFAPALNTTASNATDPTSGMLTTAISSGQTYATTLNTQINSWNDRLANIQSGLQAKFTAMQTALASLQSQQSYLTSMLKSLDSSNSSSSSN